MKDAIDMKSVKPVSLMRGDDQGETRELKQMLLEAQDYLQSFAWCPPFVSRYFGGGIGGVVALFLFEFARAIDDGDSWLWVVVGDLPSAYFVPDDAASPRAALEVYCNLMEDWSDAVIEGGDLDDVYPIAVAATVEHAQMLKSRTAFLRKEVMPRFA